MKVGSIPPGVVIADRSFTLEDSMGQQRLVTVRLGCPITTPWGPRFQVSVSFPRAKDDVLDADGARNLAFPYRHCRKTHDALKAIWAAVLVWPACARP